MVTIAKRIAGITVFNTHEDARTAMQIPAGLGYQFIQHPECIDEIDPDNTMFVEAWKGVASAFKYGRAAGVIEAVVACCGIPMVLVEPSKWKRSFHLNADKEASRQLAIGLFPHAHDQLSLRRHHQRAEAMLIALFTANNRGVPLSR